MGGGVSRAKIFKGKYEGKLEFPEGWVRRGDFQTKNYVGGVWTFSRTQSTLLDWAGVTVKIRSAWKSMNIVTISLFYLRQSLPVSANSCTFDHCFLGQELEDCENYFI